MKYLYSYSTRVGEIKIAEEDGFITNLYFENDNFEEIDYIETETETLKRAIVQIEEYLSGKRTDFSLNLNPKGTDFRKKVWNELLKIPYGDTRSYKEIAIRCQNPNACRAVGMANNLNPIPILIPCHRVVGSNKKLVGYSGGLELKKFLLELEQNKEKS